MKASLLVKIARQVEGDYVFVDIAKASVNHAELSMYVFENMNTFPPTAEINGVQCIVEYGIIKDVEIEGLEQN